MIVEIITREKQAGGARLSANHDDFVFDGEPIPREISPRAWLKEGVVHKTNILTKTLETTRFLVGPQVCITRDDIRRTTWAGIVEDNRLLLCEASGPRPNQFSAPRFERKAVADGDIWRYHLALNKFRGAVSIVWVSRSEGCHHLWLDGREVSTSSRAVDFPFLAFSQVAVGRIQTDEPKFGILTYKCRESGRLFWRRISHSEIGPECTLDVGATVGGASVGIANDRVVIRVDQLRDGKLLPTLMESDDGGKNFNKARHIDLSGYESGFNVAPGYAAPTIDKGYGIHVPVLATNGQESVALNYVLAKNTLLSFA